VYSGCERKLVYKPHRFGCPADYVTDLVWLTWSANEAVARGTFVTYAGEYKRFRVNLRASHVRICKVRVGTAGREVRARVYSRVSAYAVDRGIDLTLPGPPPCE
jgi:hypothetical protein